MFIVFKEKKIAKQQRGRDIDIKSEIREELKKGKKCVTS